MVGFGLDDTWGVLPSEVLFGNFVDVRRSPALHEIPSAMIARMALPKMSSDRAAGRLPGLKLIEVLHGK